MVGVEPNAPPTLIPTVVVVVTVGAAGLALVEPEPEGAAEGWADEPELQAANNSAGTNRHAATRRGPNGTDTPIRCTEWGEITLITLVEPNVGGRAGSARAATHQAKRVKASTSSRRLL
jgi:hypothetical protein